MAAAITVGGGEKPGTRGDRGGDLRGFDPDRPETRRAVARANVRRERMDSPQAKRERQRSRTLYRDLKAGPALGVGRASHRAVLRDRIPRPLAAARKRGMVVERYASDFAAVLRPRASAGRDEPGVMAMSTLALRSRDSAGQNRPVDLSLAQRADGRWVPENPRVDIAIGDRVGDGLRITGREIGVVPLDVADRPGTRSGDAVFFANSAPDSDHLVRVTPAGAESLVQLRSASSPERFRYRIDLPAGGAMREQRDGTIVISRDGRRVGSITPPTAWDADQQPIPVKSTLRGNVLTLDVAHRGRDIRYPSLLDPNYVDILQYPWQNSSEDGNNDPDVRLRYWSFETNDSAKIDGSSGPLEWGKGLYALSRGNQYLPTGTYGYWRFTAPGTTSVLQAEWTNMQHFAINTGGPYPCLDYGLMTTANNWRTHTKECQYVPYAYRLSCWDCDDRDGFSYDPAVNGARFGVRVYDSPTIANVYSYLGQSTLYLADNDNPTVTITTQPPAGWSQTPTGTIAATATDPGLGVQSMEIAGAGTTNNSDCLTAGPCPHSMSRSTSVSGLNLPDGNNDVLVTALDASYYSHRDANGNAVAAKHLGTATATVKLDRQPPTIEATGELRNLEGRVDDSGQDLYPLMAVARDGDPNGSPASQRVGARDIALYVAGVEQARASSDSTCVESCSATIDEYVLDTDTLEEGEHEVKLVATDRLDHRSEISWKIRVVRDGYYGDRLGAWRADVERRVDDANPLPLTGPMPAPPSSWRDARECDQSELALRTCFDHNGRWGRDLDIWLQANPMLTAATSSLPAPPIFEYARRRTAVDLTRGANAMFRIAQRSVAEPTALLPVAIGFHEPLTKDQVTALVPALDLQGNVALRAIHDPSGAAITAGYRSPLPLPLSGHLDAFYQSQLEQNGQDITEFERELADDIDGDPADAGEAESLQEALAGEQTLRTVLEAKGPFINAVTAEVSVSALLATVALGTTAIKDIRVLPPPSQTSVDPDEARLDLLGEMITDAETVTSRSGTTSPSEPLSARSANSQASAASSRQTCSQKGQDTDNTAPIFYAPGRISAKLSLYGSADAQGLHRKRASMGFRWSGIGLAWFCGDDPNDRAFEPETKVQETTGDRWGTDQENQGWKSNMPEPYLDDLNGGLRTGLKKDRFPDFAVGSGNGSALQYDRLYYTRNIINRGETDSGTVVVRVQQNRRPQGILETAYCYGKGQGRDSHCYFANRTCLVGTNGIPMPRSRRYVVLWSTNPINASCS